MPRWWIGLALSGLCTGCEGSEDAGPPDDFATIEADVLLQSCAFSICHGSGTGELTFAEGNDNHAQLVDVPSDGSPGDIRVVPGDADASYLIAKLDGAGDIVGDAMPPDAPLPRDIVGRIRRWIDAGAAP